MVLERPQQTEKEREYSLAPGTEERLEPFKLFGVALLIIFVGMILGEPIAKTVEALVAWAGSGAMYVFDIISIR